MMIRNARVSLLLSGALLLCSGTVLAQRRGFGGPPPFGEPMELMGFEGMHERKIVKGAPFSATAETTHTLQDGSVIRTSQVTMYRDSQGRSRHEVTFTGLGLFDAPGGTPTLMSITDPVAGTHFLLDTQNKVAHQMPFHARGGKAINSDAAQENFQSKMQARIQQEEAAGVLKRESLERQMININGVSVSAEGTRVTRAITVEQVGSTQPRQLQIVSERWYSPDLQIVVKSTRTDPRFGTTTYMVTKLQKSEQDASHFTVPSDYTVKQGGPGRHGMMRPYQAPPPPSEN